MMEPGVTIQCRRKDKRVVERASVNAAQQYNEISGRTVEVKVQADLSDDG
jgi:hypothetical protein